MVRLGPERIRFTPSSGNVFADLGLPDPVALDTRVQLAVEINRLIGDRRFARTAAAGLLKVSESKISALKNYKLDEFPVERLMSFLLALGQDVELRITRRPIARKRGRIIVRLTRYRSTPTLSVSNASAKTS